MAPAEANTAAAAPALPDDVLVEILLHLPAKSVFRFRTVCKSWRHLLSDPVFIREHHRRAPVALLLNDTCIDNGDAISALPFPYGDQSMAAPLYCGISSQQTNLEGCCDGLLLLSCSVLQPEELDANGNEYRYFVCNPATREFARLPADLGQVEFVGFYRHAPTAEYRVLCHKYHSSIQHPYEIYEYLVAAPDDPTARQIGFSNLWTDDDLPLIGKPVTHRSCLHWMLWRASLGVVVFDTISEEFRLMRGPVGGDTSMDDPFDGQLVGVDGTLGVTLFAESEEALKVWVLVNYEKESWAFRYNIDISFLDRTCGGGLGFYSVSLVHVSDEGDAVLITMARKLVAVYNLRKCEVVTSAMRLEPFHGHLLATDHVYQENLVSPAPKGVGDPSPPYSSSA
ncbi:hypothetical protein QYE76_035428 [Lolium multiflorum]|uniref:F-box domain-containing protein n=1 Tax=Lolium multiflorum TaxID=4521 RepID=A0AAD8R0E9_LOLMU|nr:hypothetical protein QYE76_035428 [Lolium multiflorum]